jgi:glyoxylase-like metal-dependent hydrolase (beta-lactamase superfamily II)
MRYLFLLLACSITFTNYAQRNFDDVVITSQKLSDRVYMLVGSGGNIGLAIGDEFAYVIDDQFAELTGKILAEVGKITSKPVRFVVNTHWHGDHVGGNENLGNQGAIIIAHENVRKRMNTRQDRGNGQIIDPAPFVALQKITFTDAMDIHLDPMHSMHIMHVDPAHTDGDSYIYFPVDDIIHMGDNFVDGYPFIDINSGGDIDGLIRNLNMVLFIVGENTKIIPGHGKQMGRADLVTFRDMVTTIRSRIRQAKKDGKSLEEVKQMGLTKEWDTSKGQGFIGPERLVEAVYKTVD